MCPISDLGKFLCAIVLRHSCFPDAWFVKLIRLNFVKYETKLVMKVEIAKTRYTIRCREDDTTISGYTDAFRTVTYVKLKELRARCVHGFLIGQPRVNINRKIT